MCCQGQLMWLKRTLKNFPIHGSTKALIEGAHWRWICMQESHGRPWPGGRNRIKPQPKTREKAENQICTCSGWKAKGRTTQAEAHSESYSGPIRNASGTTNPANSQCWCVKHIEGVGSAEATYEWKEKRAALSESDPDSTQRRSGKAEKLLQARAPAFRADCGELWPTFSLQRSVFVDRSVSSGCCKLNFKELPPKSPH